MHRSCVRACLVVALVLVEWLSPAGARAGKTVTVVVVRMGGQFPAEAWPEAEQRLAAELESMNVDLVHVDAEADLPTERSRIEELEQLALEHDALAVVRVVRGGSGEVHVWLNDALTQKTVLRKVSSDDLTGPDAPALLALRVVELLHASLLEIRMVEPNESELSGPVPPVVEDMVSSALEQPGSTEPGPWSVWAGPLVVVSLSRFPAVGGLVLGTSARIPRSIVTAEMDLFATPLMGKVTDQRGEADVGLAGARLHLLLEPWSRAVVSPALGVGGGVLLAWSLGQAVDPLPDRREITSVFMASFRFRLAFHLSGPVRLLSQITAGVAVPDVAVRFVGEEVARAGRPALEAAVALEWSFKGS